MAETTPGVDAPVVDAPVANTVSTPAAPIVQDKVTPPEGESVKLPKTYTEEEMRKVTSDRLQKERRRLERTVRAEVERDYLRQQLETPRQRQQPTQDKPQGPPQAKDFNDVDSYVRALLKHERAQEREAEQRERQEREPQQRQAQSQAEYARSLRDKLSDGPDKYEDFEEVVFGDDAGFTDPMVAAIHESDVPKDLAYYLATHLDELKRIAKLPATRQVGELIKIEDKLKAPPKPTGTPPPIVPGGGSAGAKKDWAQMSTEEHVKAYRNRDKRR